MRRLSNPATEMTECDGGHAVQIPACAFVALASRGSSPSKRRRFLMRTLAKVRTEMSLHVLAYNMKRVIRLLATAALIKAMQA